MGKWKDHKALARQATLPKIGQLMGEPVVPQEKFLLCKGEILIGGGQDGASPDVMI